MQKHRSSFWLSHTDHWLVSWRSGKNKPGESGKGMWQGLTCSSINLLNGHCLGKYFCCQVLLIGSASYWKYCSPQLSTQTLKQCSRLCQWMSSLLIGGMLPPSMIMNCLVPANPIAIRYVGSYLNHIRCHQAPAALGNMFQILWANVLRVVPSNQSGYPDINQFY